MCTGKTFKLHVSVQHGTRWMLWVTVLGKRLNNHVLKFYQHTVPCVNNYTASTLNRHMQFECFACTHCALDCFLVSIPTPQTVTVLGTIKGIARKWCTHWAQLSSWKVVVSLVRSPPEGLSDLFGVCFRSLAVAMLLSKCPFNCDSVTAY